MVRKYVAVTVNGIEDVASIEIKEILNSQAKKVVDGRLLFTAETVDELIYSARSIDRIYELVTDFKFKSLDDIKQNVQRLHFEINEPFMVVCKRTGKHLFNSQDVAKAVGKIVYDQGNSVSLKEPASVIYVDIIDNLCLIGIDLTKKELHKRSYRVKAHHQSINPCVAYSLLRLAEWNASKILLDPFCKDGVIAIEAALYATKVPRGYFDRDKPNCAEKFDAQLSKQELNIYAFDSLFANVRSAEVNAKLAGVNKLIKFSKTDIDWLDVKFDKKFIDNIITTLPFAEEKVLSKTCKEFFHQAEFVLKDNGRIVLVTLKKDVVLKCAHDFKLEKNVKVKIGGMQYSVLVFVKS